MKKTLALVLSLAMLLAASTAMAAVEIDYWSVFTGGDGATMQGMVDAFNASQDEVHVNHTPMTADDLYQKIPMTVQTGSGVPDVAVVHIERIPNFVTNEMLYAYDMDLINDAAGCVDCFRHRRRALRHPAGRPLLRHLHQQGSVRQV